MAKDTGSFIQLVKRPFRFKLFLLKHLPMAFLARLRIADATSHSAGVTVSFGYLTKTHSSRSILPVWQWQPSFQLVSWL